jgi:hypothetical protein
MIMNKEEMKQLLKDSRNFMNKCEVFAKVTGFCSSTEWSRFEESWDDLMCRIRSIAENDDLIPCPDCGEYSEKCDWATPEHCDWCD